jgi:hypothetical protein
VKLTDKRKTAIYGAVHDRFMDLRVQIAREHNGNAVAEKIDALISRAMDQAGQAAIEAAETGKHTRTWREGSAE